MPQTLTDHSTIKRWADQHGARPARVRGTGDGSDPGILRLDFEGYSGEDSLDEIAWSEWFRKFDEGGLALIVDESGRAPNFNKLVRRDAAETGSTSSRRGSGSRRASGSSADLAGSRSAGATRSTAGPNEESPERAGQPSDSDDELFEEDDEEFDDDELDDDEEDGEEDADRNK